jgi:hypothetical protein
MCILGHLAALNLVVVLFVASDLRSHDRLVAVHFRLGHEHAGQRGRDLVERGLDLQRYAGLGRASARGDGTTAHLITGLGAHGVLMHAVL